MGTRGKKTSPDVVDRIIKLKKEGLSVAIIAERLGLTHAAIYYILKREKENLHDQAN